MLKDLPSVDLPFHGESSLTYTNLWDLAKDLAIRVPRGSSLVGWSMGASIALMMAYLFPEKFRSLLLIGASACFSCLWSEKNLRGFMLRLEKEGEIFLSEFRAMAYPKPFKDKVDLEGAKKLLKEYMKLDIRRILPYIRQKVAILHGTEDPITPFSSAISLYNMLKNAKLITFAGGHFPRDENLIFEILKS